MKGVARWLRARGWPFEKTVRTVDTLGANVGITVGLVKDVEGRLRMAIAIGDVEEGGPTACLGHIDGTARDLMDNIATLTAELIKHGGA